MSKTITITTSLGPSTITPEQVAGCKAVPLVDSRTGQVIEGTELFISIGTIPRPLTEVMRALAKNIDEAQRPSLVLPVEDTLTTLVDRVTPPGPKKKTRGL